MPVTTDRPTERIPTLDPNDTAVLIAKAKAEKQRDLGELARIHVTQLPANLRALEEFLVRSKDGQWLKYSTAEGRYIALSAEEIARISDPYRYALQGPLEAHKDGSKDYYLFRKDAA